METVRTKKTANEKLTEQLYGLTRQFVYKYQKRFFIQYKGELEDLASDYFVEFLTPKARKSGKEENLLDKFNPEITTFEYLVKIAVQRKLIDDSRTDKKEVRYDHYIDDFGDCAVSAFGLTSEPIAEEESHPDAVEFDEDDILGAKKHWASLTPERRKELMELYIEEKCAYELPWRMFFDQIIKSLDPVYMVELPGGKAQVVQITDKTIKVVMNGDVISFNRENGKERYGGGNQLSQEFLESIKEVPDFRIDF